MTTSRIALIFTGHGERESLPVLVRRIAATLDPGMIVSIGNRRRIAEELMRKPGELEIAVEQAARIVGNKGGILIVADCDWRDGVPCKDGPMLLERARSVRPEMPMALVLAKKEYEAWFLASAESLRGKRGLPADLTPPEDVESIRAAKEWLGNRMEHQQGYAPVTDQPALTAVFDMDMARKRSASFDKCYREIVGLLQTLKARVG